MCDKNRHKDRKKYVASVDIPMSTPPSYFNACNFYDEVSYTQQQLYTRQSTAGSTIQGSIRSYVESSEPDSSASSKYGSTKPAFPQFGQQESSYAPSTISESTLSSNVNSNVFGGTSSQRSGFETRHAQSSLSSVSTLGYSNLPKFNLRRTFAIDYGCPEYGSDHGLEPQSPKRLNTLELIENPVVIDIYSGVQQDDKSQRAWVCSDGTCRLICGLIILFVITMIVLMVGIFKLRSDSSRLQH